VLKDSLPQVYPPYLNYLRWALAGSPALLHSPIISGWQDGRGGLWSWSLETQQALSIASLFLTFVCVVRA
jgi:hypothetical protein